MGSQVLEIAARAREFDLCALIQLLGESGHPLESLSFRGHATNASVSSLCEGVALLPPAGEGGEQLEILLNMGLLSANSPLPSYFRAWFETREIDEERFLSYLAFFDHQIIKNYVEVSLPQRFLMGCAQQMIGYHLDTIGLDCTSSLHWLIQLIFPELGLRVMKSVKKCRWEFSSFKLGSDRLGSNSLLGGVIEEHHLTMEVVLIADTESTDSGPLWALEIKRRLKASLFPLIRKSPLRFLFTLTIESYSRPLLLSSETSLGYQRLGPSDEPMQFPLYEGLIKDANI